MTLIDAAQVVGSFGEFFGFICVATSLIYLARQMQGNNTLIKRQQARDRTLDGEKPFLDYPELGAILAKMKVVDRHSAPSQRAYMDRYALTFQEADFWTRYVRIMWRGYEADFRAGIHEERAGIRFGLSVPDQALFWEHSKTLFSRDFAKYVDSLEPMSYREDLSTES